MALRVGLDRSGWAGARGDIVSWGVCGEKRRPLKKGWVVLQVSRRALFESNRGFEPREGWRKLAHLKRPERLPRGEGIVTSAELGKCFLYEHDPKLPPVRVCKEQLACEKRRAPHESNHVRTKTTRVVLSEQEN